MERMKIQVNIPVAIWRENDQVVIYTPALELSTYGESEKEAMSSFDEAVGLFFEVAIERGTFEDLLDELGWTYRANTWHPQQQPIPGQFSMPVDVPLPVAA